jgi:hypothetical protein
MTDLIERYIHQVGLYLPPGERAEIEAELRSQIQDELDDRYAGAASEGDVVAVLAEFGSPQRMAASYNRDQYLVGPDLYPYLMLVLRHVWLIVPTIILFLNIFGALIASRQEMGFAFIVGTVAGMLEATLIVSGLAVLIFALIQRIRSKIDVREPVFDPLELPEVDDPYAVDRSESIFGIVLGTLASLLFLYYLRVGGLALHFDLNNPGEVIPFPASWMILLIIVTLSMVILQVVMLWRKRWVIGIYLTQTLLEVSGTVCFYFAVTKPLFQHLITVNPELARVIFIAQGAEWIAVIFAVITVLSAAIKLMKLWNYRPHNPAAHQTHSNTGVQA